MFTMENGSFRLFRFAGINVFMHWSWLILAAIETQRPMQRYERPVWGLIEYIGIFAIVLLHEFGHALACRQVGGTADRIVLWPLGGIAFVNPPPRPGAMLWSIAAGPLVNVLLVPVTVGCLLLSLNQGWNTSLPDVHVFIRSITLINVGLLVFNILPIYPLDGGQIVQALLWFVIGRANSLMVVSVLGLVCGIGILGLAVLAGEWWFGLLAMFIAMRSWAGFQQARGLAKLAKLPRYRGLACPSCGAAPLKGPFWRCNQCHEAFDTFAEGAACPNCGQRFPTTACPECHQKHPIELWVPAALPVTPADEEAASPAEIV
jgi:Zn-dependent protease